MNLKKKKDSGLKEFFLRVIRPFKVMFVPSYRLNYAVVDRAQENTKRRKFVRKLKNFMTILGICIVGFIITVAVFSPWIAPFSYTEASGVFIGAYEPPSQTHPFGTGELGRDIMTRVVYGARTSLMITLPIILFSITFGTLFGLVSGYFGGWIDTFIMRFCDVLLAFPGIILALVFIAILGQRIENIMFAWGLLGIPYYARLIRGSVLQARELPYIKAAITSGADSRRIMFKHILPNVIQPIIISATFDIGGTIISLAALAYLGFGDSRLIEWGTDINIARGYLRNAPWASIFPGLMILITVFGFMLVGDGIRDALDPRLQVRTRIK